MLGAMLRRQDFHNRASSPSTPTNAGLAGHLVTVLTNDALRGALQLHARETALRFTPASVVVHLETLLYVMTACAKELVEVRLICCPILHDRPGTQSIKNHMLELP